MMDIRPLVATSDPLTTSRDPIQHHQFHHRIHQTPFHAAHVPGSIFASSVRDSKSSSVNMIIDARSHNSSPKQGETIADDGLNSKPDAELVSSSMTPTTWEHGSGLTSTKSSSLSLPSPIRNCSPSETHADLQPSRAANGNLNTPSASPSSAGTSPHSYLPSESPSAVNGEEKSRHDMLNSIAETYQQQQQPEAADLTTDHHSDTPGRASCDQPDSSPASPSHPPAGLEDTPRGHPLSDRFPTPGSVGCTTGLDASFERRSRRKPTIGDIVRRVRPPVDAPPYDSEESDIEDEMLNEGIIMKMREREHDEVDGQAKMPPSSSINSFAMGNTESMYRRDFKSAIKEGNNNSSGNIDQDESLRPYASPSARQLNRLEAVDGIPEDDEDERIMDEDEEMEMRSEEELDKHAFLKDVPSHIYNIMHEVKVNAHAMFMKTANCLPAEESRVRREQYLLQLLSNLRDRCLDEGLKPEVIASILKDVEVEVTLLGEDLEDMKEDTSVNQYFPHYDKNPAAEEILSSRDIGDSHFLNKSEVSERREADLEERRGDIPNDSSFSTPSSSHKLPSFFNTVPPALTPPTSLSAPTSTSLPAPPPPPTSSQPTSTPSSTSTSTSSSSSTTNEGKPIIVTVSADMKGPPPLVPAGGGLPPLHPLASNLSETAFSPNMFGTGKLGPWGFPGGLVNGMPLYPFSPAGPLDHALARKFLPFEGGKLPDSNADKDYLKCQYCERTFRRQKNLENHVENTHQGKGGQIKPRRDTADMYFKCSHCPYTTKHQSNLYVHLRIHTGERPYICGACGVQYSQSHSLKSHIINKHDGIMSYYIKEKRTRSPRGIGYLTTQVMHDNSIFKLPPPPLLGPPPHPHHGPHHQHHPMAGHPSDLEFVTKAIEMAKSEQQQHEQSMQQRHHAHDAGSNGSGSSDSRSSMHMTPSPLGNSNSNSNNNSGSNASRSSPSTNAKSPATPSSSGPSHVTGPHGPMFSGPHGHPPPPPFFMNGPHMSPALMFGELPPHMRNPGHMGGSGNGSGGRRSNGDHHHSHGPHGAPPMFPGFPPFPPHSPAGFPPLAAFSPNSNNSSNANSGGGRNNSSSPSSHPHLQIPPLPPHLGDPLPTPFMHHIKKEPHGPLTPQQSPQQHPTRPHSSSSSSTPTSAPAQSKTHHHHHQPQQQQQQQQNSARSQPEEGAMDLRKRSPPATPSPNSFHHDPCGGKENCAHAARLKYLRLNVVRMLGILVPNLNFAEKGISAESESVDELLQDVIESNTHEEEMMME